MRRARDVAEGANESAPIELQVGWLLEKYGVGLLGREPDVMLIMRANKLASIYRVFAKLADGGTKSMSSSEFAFIRDVMQEME